MDAGHSSHFDIVNRQTRLHLVFSFVLAKLPSRFLVGTADVWMARRQRALPVSGRLTPDHFWPRSTNMAASEMAYRGGSLGGLAVLLFRPIKNPAGQGGPAAPPSFRFGQPDYQKIF